MTDIIFTYGNCQKSQFYDVILNALLAAGWQNVTSNYATDGDVLKSNGISGDKELYMQIVPYNAAQFGVSAGADTSYSMRTKPYAIWAYRQQKKYTPGASGTAGTFSNPSRGFIPFFISPTNGAYSANSASYPIDLTVEYYIHTDKNGLILFSKMPDTYSRSWGMAYYCLPHTLYAKCDGGRGMTAITSNSSSAVWVGNVGFMADYPDDGGGADTSGANYYNVTPLSIRPTTYSPNQNGKFFFSEIYTHNDSYGMIAKLDGLLGTFRGGISNGDTLSVDGKNYVLVNTTKYPDPYQYYNDYYYEPTYPANMHAFAIRVS